MSYLLDVNILVALLSGAHRHSELAVQWLTRHQNSGSMLICRVVQMGALRILTNPAAMREHVLAPAAFWSAYDALLYDDRFRAVEEPAGTERIWRQLTESVPKGSCAETDAYLAALALAGGWTLATFDRGIARFSSVTAEILR